MKSLDPSLPPSFTAQIHEKSSARNRHSRDGRHVADVPPILGDTRFSEKYSIPIEEISDHSVFGKLLVTENFCERDIVTQDYDSLHKLEVPGGGFDGDETLAMTAYANETSNMQSLSYSQLNSFNVSNMMDDRQSDVGIGNGISALLVGNVKAESCFSDPHFALSQPRTVAPQMNQISQLLGLPEGSPVRNLVSLPIVSESVSSDMPGKETSDPTGRQTSKNAVSIMADGRSQDEMKRQNLWVAQRESKAFGLESIARPKQSTEKISNVSREAAILGFARDDVERSLNSNRMLI